MLEHEKLTGEIIAAAIEVHKRLGPGFIEQIYENALILELRKRSLKVDEEVVVVIEYDGVEVGRHRLDLLVEDTIIVELKAVKCFEDIHFIVTRSYLKAMDKEHGLLINFARPKIEVKRVMYKKDLNRYPMTAELD
jgi:GxxExxY protein